MTNEQQVSSNTPNSDEVNTQTIPSFQTLTLRKTKLKHINNFSIEIEGGKTTFLPGQRVDGYIALDLAKEMDIKLLRVRFSGVVASHLNRNDTSLINQAADMTLFKNLQNCIGSSSILDPPVKLEKGEHVYPFSFRFPPLNLPASFEGRYGRIFYEIAAVLVRPGHVNKTVFLDLTVPSTVDAQDPIFNEPVLESCRTPVGFWLWSNGHIEIKGSVPKTAFTPESIVPLELEIINHSNSALQLLGISLKQKTIYKSMDDVIGPQTEKIHRLNFSELYPPYLKRITRHVQFPVPSTNIISPSIKTSILEVNHYLVVKVAPVPSATNLFKKKGGFSKKEKKKDETNSIKSTQSTVAQSCSEPESRPESVPETTVTLTRSQSVPTLSSQSSNVEMFPSSTISPNTPSIRPLKLKKNSIFAKTCKIEVPIVIAGFPYVLLDVAGNGRESLDTLPIYENQESEDETNGNENENENRSEIEERNEDAQQTAQEQVENI